MLLLLATLGLVAASGPTTVRCGQTVRYTVGRTRLSTAARRGYTPTLVGASGKRVTLKTGNCVAAHKTRSNRGQGVDTYISGPCHNDDYRRVVTHGRTRRVDASCGVGASCTFASRSNSQRLAVGCYSHNGCTSYLQVVCITGSSVITTTRNPTTVRCGRTYRFTGTGRSAFSPRLQGARGQRVTLYTGRCVTGHPRDPDTYITSPCHNDDRCSTGARCVFTATSTNQLLRVGFFNTHHRYTSYLRVTCTRRGSGNSHRSTGPRTVRCGQTVRYTAYGRAAYTPRLVGARGKHVTINTGACVTGRLHSHNLMQPNHRNSHTPDTYFTYPCHVDDTHGCGTGARCAISSVHSNSQPLRLGCFSSHGCTSYMQVICNNGNGNHGHNGGARIVRCNHLYRYTAVGRTGYRPILIGARGMRVTINTGQCARNLIRGLTRADSRRRNWWAKDTYTSSPCRNDDAPRHACGLGSRCSATIRSARQRITVGCFGGRCTSYLRITCSRHGSTTHGSGSRRAGSTSNVHNVCWDRMGTAHCRLLKNVYQCNDQLMLHGCLESCGFCRDIANPHTRRHIN